MAKGKVIGVPKESKSKEGRVALTPEGAAAAVQRGHQVLVEYNAGALSGFDDRDYVRAGAQIVTSAAEVYGQADIVVNVKEPQSKEIPLIRPGQVLIRYLHAAADRETSLALLESRCVGFSLDTFQLDDGRLPLLAPMSKVAGRLAPQKAAECLTATAGGRGILMGGLPGVPPAQVLILGAGIVGINAADVACGMGAQVYLLDANPDRVSRQRIFNLAADMPNLAGSLFSMPSSPEAIAGLLPSMDVVIGAALIPGAKAPWLITREMLAPLPSGLVLVDVSIDQGGCFETSRATTHSNPTYVEEGAIHYCVANMPGCVPRTSTLALTKETLPYILAIADQGWERAVKERSDIRRGLNFMDGQVTCQPVAEALGLPYADISELLK